METLGPGPIVLNGGLFLLYNKKRASIFVMLVLFVSFACCSMRGAPHTAGLWLCYMPMHDVAPSAVTIAVATDAIICTINLNVSLFVMVDKLLG